MTKRTERVYCTNCKGKFTLVMEVLHRRERVFCPHCERTIKDRQNPVEAGYARVPYDHSKGM